MGEKLKQLFDRAAQKGGFTMPVKLAVKTCITTRTAATMPDTPEAIEAVQRAIDELMAAHVPDAITSRPAPAASTSYAGAGGRIKKYFDFAKERGGVNLTARLAVKTCITSQTAETTPDTGANLAKVRNALFDLLPGVAIPNF